MSDYEEAEFYARREATQRKLAARAVDPQIAMIHAQMAEEYATRVPGNFRPRLQIVI